MNDKFNITTLQSTVGHICLSTNEILAYAIDSLYYHTYVASSE